MTNEVIGEEKYGILWGLPILANNAISSVAYAGQEILLVLLPAIGVLAYGQLSVLSAVIIRLLTLLTDTYLDDPEGQKALCSSKEAASDKT